MKKLLFLLTFFLINNAWGQVYYNLSSGNYSESFANWTAYGTNWNGVAVGSGMIPCATCNNLVSTSLGGIVGTSSLLGIDASPSTKLVFLTSGTTDNSNALACDLNLNFTSRMAGSLSFDVATVNNSTGNRVSTLKVYYSLNGTSWTELTGTNLPFVSTNNVINNSSISISLPTTLNNQSTVKLRFFYHNGSGGTSGSRPKISIDNVSITSTALTPIISSSGSLSAVNTTYGTASPSPSSFNVSGANMAAGILVTPPAGYEVSNGTGGTGTYTNTVTIGSSGTIPSTPVYVRLTSTSTVASSPYTGNIVLSSTGATSVNVASVSSTVSPLAITVSGITANNKVFDGTTTATLTGSPSIVGVVNSDIVNIGGTPTATFASSAIATGISVSVTGYTISGTGSGNYSLTQPTLSADITATAPPTIGSTLATSTAFTTIYGTASTAQTSTITGSNLTTDITATAPTGFEVSNNGTTWGSTATFAQTGGSASGTLSIRIAASSLPSGSYNSQSIVLTSSGASSVNITTAFSGNIVNLKTLTITSAVANNKSYDRTTSASITGGTLNGIVGTDVVTATSGTFASSAAGTGISVSVLLTGSNASNYTLTQPGLTADITPISLTISSASAANKVFDGTTAATISGSLSSGVISPDVVTLSLSGTFASSAVGSAIAVTSTSTLGGADAGNYTLTQPTGLTANITAVPLQLLTWNTFGNAGTETTEASSSNHSTVSASSLNYTGSTVSAAGNANRFGGTNWAVGSLSTSNYIQFTLTPNAGYSFTPTSFSFIWEFSGTGPKSVTLRSSADGYMADLGSIINMSSSNTLFKTITISSLSNLSSATTFRLYGYDATANTGTGGFDCTTSTNNVILYGTTACIPATAAVLTAPIPVCNNGGSDGAIRATITGGTSPFSVVYNNGSSNTTQNSYTSGTNISVNPTSATSYTLTSITDANGCVATGLSGMATITPVTPASNCILASSSISAIEQCTDGSGWTFYGNSSSPTQLLFAINKNGNTINPTVDITVDAAANIPSSASSNGAHQQHQMFLMKRYWNVNCSGCTILNSNPVSIRFFYDPADLTSAMNARNAALSVLASGTLAVSSGNTPTWFKNENAVFNAAYISSINGNKFPGAFKILSSTTGTLNSTNYVELSGITSFSGGTAGFSFGPNGGSGNALPVTWAGFDVTAMESTNKLTWSTASEQNADYFQVEYSYNGSTFKTLTDKIKAVGNSNILNTYSATHSDFSAYVYYRIKQVDQDDRVDYSATKLVKRSSQPTFNVSVYPIPLEANKVLYMKVTSIDKSNLVIKMTDITGKVMVSKTIEPNADNYADKIDMSSMASGIYFIEIKNAQGKQVVKIVK